MAGLRPDRVWVDCNPPYGNVVALSFPRGRESAALEFSLRGNDRISANKKAGD
ncbi:hypothetical protein [Oceanicoccus sagamiensis]|uniref:hypothetical protein n=1 Tax=Oceanicoccus sagamiensis TaxID=716816 RepID=UPI0012F4FC1C|nr:hypothetical protein [Oceanicoccus sagamiensis]